MTGSDEAAEPAFWRRPGLPWLIGVAVIPLLLAVIGYGAPDRNRSQFNGPTGALPTLNVANPHGRSPASSTTSAPPSPACANLPADINALGPITFPTDGFTLTPADEQALNRIADKLKACAGAKVTINGYTDNTGTDAINVPLSARRAAAVADYLIARGVTGDQLTAKGLGSAAPVADNGVPDGQAKNRRVEIGLS